MIASVWFSANISVHCQLLQQILKSNRASKAACCRTFPAEPHQPHTLSIDFAPKSAAGSQAAAEDVVMAGIEVGGCLVSASDGLWETRHGPIVSNTQRTQLCVDVHQVRPDPFDGNRCVYTSTFLRKTDNHSSSLG